MTWPARPGPSPDGPSRHAEQAPRPTELHPHRGGRVRLDSHQRPSPPPVTVGTPRRPRPGRYRVAARCPPGTLDPTTEPPKRRTYRDGGRVWPPPDGQGRTL